MSYKLSYFPAEAKAELIRFIFVQTDTEYQNIRIPFEEWPALKPSTPFGYLPILEVDGETLAGSGPIARYMAEKLGLAGSSDIENVKIAGIKDVQDEVVVKMVRAFFEKDEAKKKAAETEVIENFIPKYLNLMETIIKGNPNPGCCGWLFGPKLTYVDLNLYLIVDFMKIFKEENLLEEYPGVKKLTDAVGALPNIAKWIQTRPKRTFGPPVV